MLLDVIFILIVVHKTILINDLRAFVAHVVVVVVIVEVLDAMTDATMVGTVAVEDMTTIAAHLHPTIDVMITDEDLDLDLTHHVSYDFYKDKNTRWLGILPELAKKIVAK